MPHALPIYLVSCSLKTDVSKAKMWALMQMTGRLQTVDEESLMSTSLGDDGVLKLQLRTVSPALAQRVYSESSDILARVGVTANDVVVSEPVTECDHVPKPKPDIDGRYDCVACGQFLGSLSWAAYR